MNRRALVEGSIVVYLFFSSLSFCQTVTDIDGNIYQTITIGTQIWMAQNLKVTHFRNGDPIPNITNKTEWGFQVAYCDYNNDVSNASVYGRLYTWYAANDNRYIAPVGWHVPSDAEWQSLVDYLGGDAIAGGKLKETGTVHWNSPNTGATNESGFSALPGGCRYGDGVDYNMGSYANFWSSTEADGAAAWSSRCLDNSSGVSSHYDYKSYGFSIRLVSDVSLSVGLTSISARVKGRSVIIDWITESEVDNLGFILEKQEAETESWIQIASYQTHASLLGQGNTSVRTEYSYTDSEVEPGKEYCYRLSDVSTSDIVTAHSPISIEIDDFPESTRMENAYPNPFNPQTYISYHLQEDAQVTICVYDILGHMVNELYNGRQFAGSYHVYWNGTNETGVKVPSGCYIVRMETEDFSQIQKVILMK